MGTISPASSRLLASNATAAIRFVPAPGSTGGSISFRAWDQTAGTNGALLNATTTGGTTSVSAEVVARVITVNASPVLALNTGFSVAEGAAHTITNSDAKHDPYCHTHACRHSYTNIHTNSDTHANPKLLNFVSSRHA